MSTAFEKKCYTFSEVRNNPKSYRAHVSILREEDGGYSVIVLNLPGAGSCGDTLDEAIANVKEAVLGVVESYQEDEIPVPWITDYEMPKDATCKWILVNA